MNYGPTWVDDRQVALQRDFNQCIICGHQATEVHHRVVQGMGGRSNDEGRHSPEKLISLCTPHHTYVHLERELARDLGYFVWPDRPPEQQYVWCPVDCAWYELMTSGIRLAWPNLRSPEVQIL